MTSAAPPYHLPTNPSETSLRAPTLPPYSEHAGASARDEDIELASLSPSTSASSHGPTTPASPSSSQPARAPFTPTKQLQIQTPGKNLLSFPTPQRPDPIPIFALTPEGRLDRPLYLSVRPEMRSGTCFLAHGDDAAQTPLTTTTYRFGPGRPPVVALGDPARHPAVPPPSEGPGEGFEILGRSLFSRAVRFEVPGLGSFGWRYAGAEERASAGADSLLVCEVFLPDAAASSHRHKTSIGARLGLGRQEGGGGEEKETPRRIAQLVRNEMFRSPGTSRSSAGNGGRLMLDLAVFDEKRRERVEWLVVTTGVTMLKREVDRRRAQQIATIGAIVS